MGRHFWWPEPLKGTLKNPVLGIFQYGARKVRFPSAFIFMHLCARKWRGIPAPRGHLEFFKVP
jgi:hypothetical protein